MEQQTNQEKPYNIDSNIEAALSYIPLVGIGVFVMEKENKFVRFHALQSIFYWVAVLIAQSIASTLTVVFIGIILVPLVGIAAVAGWVFMMWKAYNKEEYELPFIGKIAKEQAYK